MLIQAPPFAHQPAADDRQQPQQNAIHSACFYLEQAICQGDAEEHRKQA
jgi:hypothetical protein